MVIRRTPSSFGYQRSRWTLAMLQEVCKWLRVTTAGGLSQLLKRLGISYKRGRDYIHSPDPNYEAKVAYVQARLAEAMSDPDKIVFLYLDEFTYYRQPSVARAYEEQGHEQARAYRSIRSNTQFRGIATLDVLTGKVVYQQRSRLDIRSLSRFYADLCQAYPDARTIYVVQDNWPVHAHPDVLARLETQRSPFCARIPGHWSQKPTKRAVHDNLPIQLLFLPTYSAWLNPVEKLWRWVRQDVIHMHRLADDWTHLKQQVADFISQFADGSTELLNYVGLLSD